MEIAGTAVGERRGGEAKVEAEAAAKLRTPRSGKLRDHSRREVVRPRHGVRAEGTRPRGLGGRRAASWHRQDVVRVRLGVLPASRGFLRLGRRSLRLVGFRLRRLRLLTPLLGSGLPSGLFRQPRVARASPGSPIETPSPPASRRAAIAASRARTGVSSSPRETRGAPKASSNASSSSSSSSSRKKSPIGPPRRRSVAASGVGLSCGRRVSRVSATRAATASAAATAPASRSKKENEPPARRSPLGALRDASSPFVKGLRPRENCDDSRCLRAARRALAERRLSSISASVSAASPVAATTQSSAARADAEVAAGDSAAVADAA